MASGAGHHDAVELPGGLGHGVVVGVDAVGPQVGVSREVDLDPGTILAQKFRRGKPVEARIIGQDTRRDRLTLSMRTDNDTEQQSWRSHVGKPSGKDSGGFNPFAALLSGVKIDK